MKMRRKPEQGDHNQNNCTCQETSGNDLTKLKYNWTLKPSNRVRKEHI